MSFSSEGEPKESTVEEKKETTTKPGEHKRRVRRGRREGEQTIEVAKEKSTTTAVPTTIPKRLLNRIDKHDTYLATIQRDVRLLNRELKKLTTRVNRVEARLVSLRARAKAKATKGSSSSSKKKKGRSKR
jgi:hypothetical protein